MAVRDQLIASLVEAVAALNERVNAAADAKAIPGPQGEKGDPGERGDVGPAPSEAEIKAAAAAWLAANITQPADGAPGPQGEQGPQGERGPGPTDEEISLAVDVWFEINREQLRGADGRDGRDGADGAAGRDGARGPAGERGPAGADGIGIALVEQRDERSFWITLTDGQEFEIELPKPRSGGGGGGIYSITSNDGTVDVTQTGGVVDLSVTTVNVFAFVRNRTGVTIPKGSAVYISGATGQTSEISLALATSDATSAQTLGLTSTDIPHNGFGYVTSFGYLSDINTSAYTDGQQLYLSPTVPGGMTAIKPQAPNHIVYVAVVEYAHPNHGKLFVKVQNGYELDEIHDVLITAKANGDAIIYNSSLDVWENKPLSKAVRIGTNGATLSGLLAIDANAVDQYNISGLTGPTTLAATTGAPVDGQKLIVRIVGGASPVALTFTTGVAQGWRALGTALPTTTIPSKTIYIGSIYNSAANRWDVVAVAQEA